MVEKAMSLPNLRDQLNSHFSIEEIHDIYFDLAIDHENIKGQRKLDICRELVLECQRRGVTPKLIQRCRTLRPNVTWPDILGTGGIVAAVEQLNFRYSQYIQNFLDEYLGKPGQPVPFGGRQKELNALDAWLRNDGSSQYMLMVAQAGRGKSALLAHWVQQVQTQGETNVVFVPISIRFNTASEHATYQMLAGQIGDIYGEHLQISDRPALDWQEIYLSLLRRDPVDGRKVLVIIDGLDEATGNQCSPNLLPAGLPLHICGVVSVRDTESEKWRRRLGWDRPGLAVNLPLPKLTQTGIADVLRAMGNPLDELTSKVDILTELERLSEGDPLLVRLYVEALRRIEGKGEPLQPEALTNLDSGLSGYFNHYWWKDQELQWQAQGRDPLFEGQAVKTLLDMCAAALGPLSREDVMALAPETLGSAQTLKRAVQDSRRLILGDGAKQGYVFSHPRLNQYFWEQMGRVERRIWEQRFLSYGQATLAALNNETMQTTEASNYVLQQFGAHLERAEKSKLVAPTDFYALLTSGWVRAWEIQEGTYSGFLQDTARAWARANEHGDIEIQVRCALCQSSIVSLGNNMLPELLEHALETNLLSPVQALAIIHQTKDGARRAGQLKASARYFDKAALDEALSLARSISDTSQRVEALVGLIPHLEQLEGERALSEVIEAAWDIDNRRFVYLMRSLVPKLGIRMQALILTQIRKRVDWIQVGVLSSLLPNLEGREREEALYEALALARGISDPLPRVIALVYWLLPHLVDAEQKEVLAEALTAAPNIEDEYYRLESYAGLLPYLAEPEQKKLLNEALVLVSTSSNHRLYGIFAHLAPYMKDELLDEAMSMARSIKTDEAKAQILARLATSIGGAEGEQILHEALVAAWRYDEERRIQGYLGNALLVIAPDLRGKLLEEALNSARSLTLGHDRVYALSALISQVERVGQAKIVGEALQAARSIEDYQGLVEVIISLMPYLHESECDLAQGEVLLALQHLGYESAKTNALKNLAPHLCGKRTEEGLEVARGIRNVPMRVSALLTIAAQCKGTILHEVENEATEVARSVEDQLERALALSAIASHLVEMEDLRWSEVLGEALLSARDVPSAYIRMDKLVDLLLLRLEPAKQLQALTKALTVAEGNALYDAEVLGSLLSYLKPAQQIDILARTLAAARDVHHRDLRIEAILQVVPYLNGVLLAEALEVAKNINDIWKKAYMLAMLALYLDDVLLTESLEALEEAQELASDWVMARARVGNVRHSEGIARKEAINEALSAALSVRDEGWRVNILAALVPYLEGEELRMVLEEALEAVRRLTYDDHAFSIVCTPQWRVLNELTQYIHGEILSKALEVISCVQESWVRNSALAELSADLVLWADTSPVEANLAWGKALVILAQYPREALMSSLSALMPFCMALVGNQQTTSSSIFLSIRDVEQWWP